MKLTPITEEFVRRVADLIGDSSAAASAIRDYEKRKVEVPHPLGFYLSDDNAFVVGPAVYIEH